jgi:hypothetical protein
MDSWMSGLHTLAQRYMRWVQLREGVSAGARGPNTFVRADYGSALFTAQLRTLCIL